MLPNSKLPAFGIGNLRLSRVVWLSGRAPIVKIRLRHVWIDTDVEKVSFQSGQMKKN